MHNQNHHLKVHNLSVFLKVHIELMLLGCVFYTNFFLVCNLRILLSVLLVIALKYSPIHDVLEVHQTNLNFTKIS